MTETHQRNLGDVRPSRILVATDRHPLLRSTTHLLEAAGHQVHVIQSLPRAESWLRTHHVDLIVVEVDMSEEGQASAHAHFCRRWAGRPRSDRRRVLAITRAGDPKALGFLIQQGSVTNVIGVGSDGTVDPVEFARTVAKILGGSIFGIDDYLATSPRMSKWHLTSSDERHAVVASVEELAGAAGCRRHLAANIATAAEELLTNAFFNAPVDEEGRRLSATRDRNERPVLTPDKAVAVTVGFDNRRFAISVTDAFGSLQVDHLRRYLIEWLGETSQVRWRQGGAGIGLQQVFRTAHQFVVNLAPGRRTEVISVIDAAPSLKRHASRTKSFNLFVAPARGEE